MNNINTERKYLVVGCGGLGCYIVEGLIRLNVKEIKVCDPDTFSEDNLNRQLYATKKTLNLKKVEVALNRSIELGYTGKFTAISKKFEVSFLDDIDVVIDCLDNIEDRLILEDACSRKNIPLVHGAVEGFSYQVGLSMPGSNLLHNIYKDKKEPKENKTNVITVMQCASKELSLAIDEPKEFFEVYDI